MKFLNKILKRSQEDIDPRFENNKKIRKELYVTDPRIIELKLSDNASKWYQELSENGIVKIENEFNWVRDIYKKEYFDAVDNKFILKDLITERALITGRVFAKSVSLGDPALYNWYFNNDLIGLLGKFYKQQPFYRNQPMIQTYEVNEDHSPDIAGKWHIDGGLNQISFMLLINDITDDDTHMKFALKSIHNDHKILDRDKLKSDEIESQYQILNCTGKAGTLFIFHGGKGFHRAEYKTLTSRSIYHVNFTPGHDIQNFGLENKKNLPELKDEPFYVRECANLILE
jgi:hypothetical protein